jgi:hypothetical protein
MGKPPIEFIGRFISDPSSRSLAFCRAFKCCKNVRTQGLIFRGKFQPHLISFAGNLDFSRLGAGTPNPLGGAREHPGYGGVAKKFPPC